MGRVIPSVFLAALVSCLPAFGADQWTFSSYQQAMQASGRPAQLTDREFQQLQARKPRYLQIVRDYLQKMAGFVDPAVIRAFEQVPREYFSYDYESGRGFAAQTYESDPHPWAIGYGSYLSDYRSQAYMTQVLRPKPTDISLEIGTGSGFQSAVLSRIVKEAYTVEIISALGEKVDRIFRSLGYSNVRARVGDGFFGWPEAGKQFDIIIVTCAAPYVPPPLLEQLKKGGRMIIPIGQPYKTQFLYLFTKDDKGKIHSRKDMGTYFIPMTGKIQG
jgi:protein-L-isoaspartate(D-aspartate) O-methyltransferase